MQEVNCHSWWQRCWPVCRFTGRLWRRFALATPGALRCPCFLLLFLLFASFSARILLVLLAAELGWRFFATKTAGVCQFLRVRRLDWRSWCNERTVSTQDNNSMSSRVTQCVWQKYCKLRCIKHRTTSQRALESHNVYGKSNAGWGVSNTGQQFNEF